MRRPPIIKLLWLDDRFGLASWDARKPHYQADSFSLPGDDEQTRGQGQCRPDGARAHSTTAKRSAGTARPQRSMYSVSGPTATISRRNLKLISGHRPNGEDDREELNRRSVARAPPAIGIRSESALHEAAPRRSDPRAGGGTGAGARRPRSGVSRREVLSGHDSTRRGIERHAQIIASRPGRPVIPAGGAGRGRRDGLRTSRRGE